jgi:XTP/dITP diphosphohydrolase
MSAGRRIVLASGNAGKLAELEALLAPWIERLIPQSFYFVPEADETGTTFIENAIIKARNAAEHTGLPSIADDSGLVIPALDGEPGVRSARWHERRAHYRCALVYLRHSNDPAPLIAQGVWQGEVVETAAGSQGFGYDPHFYVPEHHRTAAELGPELKNSISHRGQALKALRAQLEQEWRAL